MTGHLRLSRSSRSSRQDFHDAFHSLSSNLSSSCPVTTILFPLKVDLHGGDGVARTFRRTLRAFAQPRRLCLIELIVERFQADAEFVGGLGLVAGVTVERVLNRLHLDVLERLTGRRIGGAAESAGGKTAGEMFGQDRAGVAKDQRVFDHVGQLAHVARPTVLGEGRESFRTKDLFARLDAGAEPRGFGSGRSEKWACTVSSSCSTLSPASRFQVWSASSA